MDILGILFILWAILIIFEVAVISSMKVTTFKYIKLLKFLEFFYVVLTIISIDFYLYIDIENESKNNKIIIAPFWIFIFNSYIFKYLEGFPKLIIL